MESIYKSNKNAKPKGMDAETKWSYWSGRKHKPFLGEATLMKVENVLWKQI